MRVLIVIWAHQSGVRRMRYACAHFWGFCTAGPYCVQLALVTMRCLSFDIPPRPPPLPVQWQHQGWADEQWQPQLFRQI